MKAHISKWNGKWFVTLGCEGVGCVFTSFRAACDKASYITLKDRKA